MNRPACHLSYPRPRSFLRGHAVTAMVKALRGEGAGHGPKPQFFLPYRKVRILPRP